MSLLLHNYTSCSYSVITLCMSSITLCSLGILRGLAQALLRTGEESAIRHQLGIRVQRHTESGFIGEIDSTVYGEWFVEEQVTKGWVHRLSVW
jgi:hypothetical protein